MSKVRDLPPVSGSIIWARQIDRQLSAYMRRVEDVLGKGWENHVEGQRLKADGDSFRLKLNTQELFDEWSRKVSRKDNYKYIILSGVINFNCINVSVKHKMSIDLKVITQ